jgi:YD repeat-containing protein
MSVILSRFVRALFAVSLLLAGWSLSPATAQVAPPAPVRQNVDGNGVDLFLGTFNVEAPSLSGGRGIDWKKINLGAGWGDNVVATLKEDAGVAYVSLGTTTDRFNISGSVYTSTEGKGAKLTLSGTTYTYTMSDGTVIHFTKSTVGTYPYDSVSGLVTGLTRPSGDTLTFSYESTNACIRSKPGGGGYICTQHQVVRRIGSVSNSAGDQLDFHYLHDLDFYLDYIPVEPWDSFWTEWGVITSVTSPGGSQSMGQSTVGSTIYFNVTNALGQISKYRMAGNKVVGITRTGGTSEDVTIAYNASGKVSGITTPDGTTGYTYSDASGVRTVTVTNPESEATVYRFDIASNRLASVTNALSQTTTYKYDSDGRVTHVVAPEGTITSGTPETGYTKFTYDARGNVTETRQVAKAGSILTDIFTTADYDATCTSPAKCNKPNWTQDAKGKQTDYTYNATTGNILTMTLPPATSGGTRPKMTYSYTGVNGVMMVTGISTCRAGATCAGTVNEVKTTIAYDSLQRPTSVTTAAGDGSVSSTTGYAYDTKNNLISVDGPLSGTDDTITYRYDALQRRVGQIGPDPDGTGPRKRQAIRTTYDALGRATLVEVGTVTGTDDTA